jgi:hypothetical protein
MLASVTVLVVNAGPAPGDTVPLPNGANTGSQETLNSTSCPAAGTCVAVGSYTDGSGHLQGLIETQSGGAWAAAEAKLTTLSDPASASPAVSLDSVSCASVANCVAVGQYTDATGSLQGLIESDSGGTWTASTLNLTALANVTSNPHAELVSVSCPASGYCVAVGGYTDAQGNEGLIATLSGSGWTTTEAPVAGLQTASNPDVALSQVSCGAAGSCAAVGSFDDAGGSTQGLLETDSGGRWTAGEADLTGLPSVAVGQDATVDSVSCPAAGSCTAVGFYRDGAPAPGSYQGMLLSQSNGSWSPATEARLPANANPSGTGSVPGQFDLNLDAVACASVGNCTAVGDYDAGASNDVEGMELTETGGTWSAAQETSLPSGVAGDPQATLDSVACTAAARCVAAGSYEGSDGDQQALIAQQSGAGWAVADVPQHTSYDTTDPQYYLRASASAACSASGYCAAVGYTKANSGAHNDVAFTLDAPAAEQSLQAEAFGVTAATLSWGSISIDVSGSSLTDAGELPITGYTVTANDLTDSTRGGQTASGANARQATITGLTSRDTYTFTVTDDNILGTGIPATSASVTLPSRAQLTASLGALVTPHGAASHLRRLRRTHSYTFTFRPLESGKVTIRWYQISGHGKHRHKHLVASGSATTTGTSAVTVHVRLTALGRRLVRADRTLRLTSSVTFVSGSTTVTRTRAFTLR